MHNHIRIFHNFGLLLGIAILSAACATATSPDTRDPWESVNRSIYNFNDTVDRAVGRPVAQAYKDYVPVALQRGTANFFSNLDDVAVIINDILQFKFAQAVQDFARLIVNSIIGVYGLFDVATELDLPKHKEDFGQTLATWGVGDGPYMVLPFLGPSTLRDTASIPVDWKTDPVMYIDDINTRNGAVLLRLIDKRASYLEASRTMDKSGIDPYVFMRDAYYQYRANLIHDGNPPAEKIPQATKEDRQLEDELEKELQGGAPTK